MLKKEFIENYERILTKNLFVFLAEQRIITAATLCDPEGKLCFKLDSAIKNLKTVKIKTLRTDLYEDYLDSLLSLYGVCPALCKTEEVNPFYLLKTEEGREITLGAEGFRCDADFICCPEAEALCPKSTVKKEFFTLLALLGGFEPLLNLVPQHLVLKENLFNIHRIF